MLYTFTTQLGLLAVVMKKLITSQDLFQNKAPRNLTQQTSILETLQLEVIYLNNPIKIDSQASVKHAKDYHVATFLFSSMDQPFLPST